MFAQGIFDTSSEEKKQFHDLTWKSIGGFLPGLKEHLSAIMAVKPTADQTPEPQLSTPPPATDTPPIPQQVTLPPVDEVKKADWLI